MLENQVHNGKVCPNLKDPAPVEMLVEKILLPNLVTTSAYQRLTIGLVLSHWVDRHYKVTSDKSEVPAALKTKLLELLTTATNFDETKNDHYTLQACIF